MKLTIERNLWLRGNEDESMLRNYAGQMCCLGFLGMACGGNLEDMEDIGTPCELPEVPWPKELVCDSPNPLFKDNTEVCKMLMNINDKDEISDREREQQLKEVFATIGIEAEFV